MLIKVINVECSLLHMVWPLLLPWCQLHDLYIALICWLCWSSQLFWDLTPLLFWVYFSNWYQGNATKKRTDIQNKIQIERIWNLKYVNLLMIKVSTLHIFNNFIKCVCVCVYSHNCSVYFWWDKHRKCLSIINVPCLIPFNISNWDWIYTWLLM